MPDNPLHLDHYVSFHIIIESIKPVENVDKNSGLRSYYTQSNMYEVKLANYKKENINIPEGLDTEADKLDIDNKSVVILNRVTMSEPEDVDNLITFLQGLKDKMVKTKETK